MKDRLPHVNELVNQIVLDCGGPLSSFWRLMMPYIAFHKTSTRPIPLKSVPPPLGIITTICKAHVAVSSPPLKAACMVAMIFSQLPGSGCSSRVATQSHILRCLDLMTDRPVARCCCCCRTASSISSYPGILSFTGKGPTYMIICFPVGRMWA